MGLNHNRTICSLIFFFLLSAVQVAYGDVLMTSGQYHETTEDMRVKVLGGYVTLERTWYEGQWHLNRAWNPLKFHPDVLDGSVKSIERNFKIYEKADLSSDIFIFGRRKTLSPIPTGYRWQDREGNWIEYNATGQMTSYGDRNNIKVSIQYDSEGKRTGVFDHSGNQVFWYEYDAEGRVTAVHDATDRRVEYVYSSGMLTQVKDVRGYVWEYRYDSSGRLTGKTDPEGRHTTITYSSTGMVTGFFDHNGNGLTYKYADYPDQKLFYVQIKTTRGRIDEYWYNRDGRLVRHDLNGRCIRTLTFDGDNQIKTDALGNKTTTAFDSFDNPTRIIYPDGSEVKMEYNPIFSGMTRHVNENGVETRYEYDAKGNLLKMIEAAGTTVQRATEYQYDQYGRRTLARRVADAVTPEALTRYTYDDQGNILTETDPEGNINEYTHDIMGNILTYKDPRQKVWTSTYDNAGNLLSKSSPLPGQTTNYQYDKVGNRVKEINADSKETIFVFDVRDRLAERLDPLGGSYKYFYDNDGNLIRQEDEEGKNTRFEYDLDGRLTKTIDGNGNEIRQEYDDGCSSCGSSLPSRIIYPTYSEELTYDTRYHLTEKAAVLSDNSRLTTSYSYDLAGDRVTETDRKGRTTKYEYDALNRLVKTIRPTDNIISYTYDSRDNLLSLTDPNTHTYHFAYDRNNHQTGEVWPLGEITQFVYDQAGNLTEKIDAKNQKAEHVYDDANRLTGLRYYNTAADQVPVKTVNFTYDVLNSLTGYNDGITAATYDYDDLKQKTHETVNYGPFSLSYSYGYYRNGLKKSYTGPDALTYEYEYDAAGNITAVKFPDNSAISFAAYNWNRPTRILYPGGTVRELGYDDLMQTQSIVARDPSGNTLMDFQYTYDPAGNIASRTTQDGPYNYSYDDLDQLTGVINTPTGNDESYSYDPAGNRLGDHNVPPVWEYNDNNQLLTSGDSSYQYDANGSLIHETENSLMTTFTYNLENRLSKIEDNAGTEIGEYYYDPFGRRLWKDAGGSRIYFMYSDEGLVGEYDSTGTEIKSYSYLPDSTWTTDPLFLKEAASYYFYQNDHLGTSQKLTSQLGSIVWEATHEGFGQAIIGVAITDNNLRFPGQYFDVESGNHYNWYRFYSPEEGRYFAVDPLSIEGGFNKYLFVFNNPLNNFDEWGLKTKSAICDCEDSVICDEAKKRDFHIKQDGNPGGGGVVCCNGRKISCDWNPDMNLFSKEADDLIRKCIITHEDSHKPQVKCEDSVGLTRSYSINPNAADSNEMFAYRKTIACLWEQKRKCTSDLCKKDLEDAIKYYMTVFGKYRNNKKINHIKCSQ